MSDLNQVFEQQDRGGLQMMSLLRNAEISEITANSHDRIFFVGPQGKLMIREQIFAGEHQYVQFLNQLLRLTDAGYADVAAARTSVIEGSFRLPLKGSIHICTAEITRGEPFLTVRKQPDDYITLDQMVDQRMMSAQIRDFLVVAVRGRLNVLLSGGSGAGKTTLARALSAYIDPSHRVCTVEEIDELHIRDRIQNVVDLTSYRLRDDQGRVIRETTLDDLVREALRMRADRIWVGETRGKEAYSLCKACNSGHDGSLSTLHADDGEAAVQQAVTYVMEGGVAEDVARDQVARAFHMVVQITKIRPTERRITEITELEPVREGTQQRRNTLFRYDYDRDSWQQTGQPTPRLIRALERNGVNL